METTSTTTTTYREISMQADKNGKPRFRVLRHCRTFPVPMAEALASIEAGCSVYVGNLDDAIHGRGHYATPAELSEFLGV